MPKAIEPIDAHINIAKFNKSAIVPAPICPAGCVQVCNLPFACPQTVWNSCGTVAAILSEVAAALTLISIDQ
jgi:hypothetical protein